MALKDFEGVFDMGGYTLPTFIKPYVDKPGTRRISVGERPQGDEEQLVWDLIHQQFREHRISVEDWGDLTGPLSLEEVSLLSTLCKGKTPGISGTKITSLEVFPDWVFKLFLALVNSMLALGLVPDELKQISSYASRNPLPVSSPLPCMRRY